MKILVRPFILFLLWLLLCCSHVFSQEEPALFYCTKVVETYRGEIFEVTCELKNYAKDLSDNIEPERPLSEGLEVLGEPAESSSLIVKDGIVHRTKRWTFNLKAAAAGEYLIKPLTLKMGDTILQSNPVTVIVYDKSTLPVSAGKEVFIDSRLSVQNAVAGQQVFLEYVLYTTKAIDGIDYPDPPALPGVQVNQITRFGESTITAIRDNTQYASKAIMRFALYPLEAGTVHIPELVFKLYQSKENTQEESFFERSQMLIIPVHDSLKLEVLPIPDMPVENFAVDCDEMLSSPLKPADAEGHYTCQLTMKGHGHPMFLLPPDLKIPHADVKVELLSEEKRELNNAETVTREFRYRIAFFKKDTYRIQPSVKSWNSKSGQWETVTTASPRDLEVEKTARPVNSTGVVKAAPGKPSPKDVVWVVDVSSSMLAKDFEPSRLEVLKQKLRDLAQTKPAKERICIVAFAEGAVTLLPFTANKDTLQAGIGRLETGITGDGTSIGDGMFHALAELESGKAAGKEIVVFSDFVGNSGNFRPEYAAGIISTFKVGLTLVVTGKEGEALTPISRRSNGEYVFGHAKIEINKELPGRLSKEFGGRVFLVDSQEAYEVIKPQLFKTDFPQPSKAYPRADDRLMAVYFQNIKLLNNMAFAKLKK